MLNSLRRRVGDEGGFTLIELLVVVLIIGILSAIAIPAFLSQTSKANDAAAKTQVGTLQTTIESYATEHNGSYSGATLASLEEIEPTLKDKTTAEAQEVLKATSNEYEVESISVGTGDAYKLKNENGTITRSCTVKGNSENTGGGCKAGSW